MQTGMEFYLHNLTNIYINDPVIAICSYTAWLGKLFSCSKFMYSKERYFGVHENEISNDFVSYDSHIRVSVWGVCTPRPPVDEFAFCLSTPIPQICFYTSAN